ncbi:MULTISPECIES: hypothetical protein [unclassified Nocardiopsis]|nr:MULTISPECIES: hypothetical protein [unclassified Nocardiopsis]
MSIEHSRALGAGRLRRGARVVDAITYPLRFAVAALVLGWQDSKGQQR